MAKLINMQICVDEMIRVWHSFRATWDNTRNSWKDTGRDQFEREHVREYSDASQTYIVNLRKLAETIQQILNEAP